MKKLEQDFLNNPDHLPAYLAAESAKNKRKSTASTSAKAKRAKWSLTYQSDDEVESWNGDGELSDIADFDSDDEDDDTVLEDGNKENTTNNLQNDKETTPKVNESVEEK